MLAVEVNSTSCDRGMRAKDFTLEKISEIPGSGLSIAWMSHRTGPLAEAEDS